MDASAAVAVETSPGVLPGRAATVLRELERLPSVLRDGAQMHWPAAPHAKRWSPSPDLGSSTREREDNERIRIAGMAKETAERAAEEVTRAVERVGLLNDLTESEDRVDIMLTRVQRVLHTCMDHRRALEAHGILPPFAEATEVANAYGFVARAIAGLLSGHLQRPWTF